MALIVRLIMVVITSLLLIVILGISAMIGLEGDYSGLFDLVDLDEELPAPPPFAASAAIFAVSCTFLCLIRAFWAVHRILKPVVQDDFLKLARQLQICAFSLIACWVCMQIVIGPATWALLQHIPVETRPSLDYFPFELEAVYLVLALPLLVTASALRRAADIEEENSQFL